MGSSEYKLYNLNYKNKQIMIRSFFIFLAFFFIEEFLLEFKIFQDNLPIRLGNMTSNQQLIKDEISLE